VYNSTYYCTYILTGTVHGYTYTVRGDNTRGKFIYRIKYSIINSTVCVSTVHIQYDYIQQYDPLLVVYRVYRYILYTVLLQKKILDVATTPQLKILFRVL
jgi:hypothetical protein